MRDVCDGAALLTVVHYYCPDHMKIEGITDSLGLLLAIYGVALNEHQLTYVTCHIEFSIHVLCH